MGLILSPHAHRGDYEIKGKYRGYKSIYTDGSQSHHQAAAAAVMDKKVYSERLPNRSSIFSAVLHALFLALDHVETDSSQSFIIFSDSKSALESLKSKDWKNPLVLKILEKHYYLYLSVIRSLFIVGYLVILGYRAMSLPTRLQRMV